MWGITPPPEEVVVAVNRKPRGWSRYFSVGTLEPAYRTVDRYTEALFRQFLVRRHKVPGRGTRRVPLGPSSPMTDPGSIENDTSERAKPGKLRQTLFSARICGTGSARPPSDSFQGAANYPLARKPCPDT